MFQFMYIEILYMLLKISYLTELEGVHNDVIVCKKVIEWGETWWCHKGKRMLQIGVTIYRYRQITMILKTMFINTTHIIYIIIIW